MAIIFAGKPAEIGAQEDVKFESNLISLVKFFPCIHDTTDPDYNNMRQNNVAWVKLSNSLQRPIMECINKWYALLQIFLCLNKQLKEEDSYSSITWHHYYQMLKVGPKTPLTYAQLVKDKPPFFYPEPVSLQKEVLVRQMELNRKELLSVYVSLEQKQKIWLQMAQKLNAFHIRVNMPMIKWQKYWCDLKQAVIDVKRKSLLTPSTDGNRTSETNNFLQDDIKILNLFGVKPTDTLEDIALALSGSMEIDCDVEKVTKCSRCNKIIRDNCNETYCDACSRVPKSFCDICLRIYQVDLNLLNVKEWSFMAKDMLPPHLALFSTISMCSPCLVDLKRQAGAKWVACRICESYSPPLANLFSNENEVLRKAFSDATNIKFKETDGLPHYICKSCKVQMQQFNNFYLKYSRVQTRLLDIHEEFFIGVNGIIVNKSKNNLKAAVQKATTLKSGLNALSEQVSNTKLSLPSAGVKKFTIGSPSSNSTTVQITKATKVKQTVVPAGTHTPNILNREYVGPYGVPSSTPLGNVAVADKSMVSQKPSTLQIIKGLPPGTNVKPRRVIPAANVKAHQLSPALAPNVGTVRAQNLKSLYPKQQGVQSANSPAPNQNVVCRPVNVRKLGIPTLPANTTICTKQKQMQFRTTAPNSSTVSGIITNQISNSPMLSSITIKTKSGTTTLSTNTKYLGNNPKVSTVAPSTSSVTSVPKTVYSKAQAEQPTPVNAPTVFKIPDDMYDPNSPPAFCIPKSPSQAQSMAMSGFKAISANTDINETPQNTVTPTVANPPQIKTEIVDEEYPIDVQGKNQSIVHTNSNCNTAENNIPMSRIYTSAVEKKVPEHPSTGFQQAFQSPLTSAISKAQSYGNTTALPETAKADSGQDYGVKKQQQSIQQPSLPAASSGNKRPRKYWGAVDEFHIPSKLANHNQSMNEGCPDIEIKEERVDLVEDNVNKDDQDLSNIEAFASTFYSDSFELGAVSLDAHVTDVLTHMIAHHQSSVNSEPYQFASASFMTSFNEKSGSTNNEECKSNSDREAQSECNLNDASMTNMDSTTSNTSKPTLECELNEKVKLVVEAKAQSECKSNKEPKAQPIGKTLNLRELRLKIEKSKDIPKENKINSNIGKSKKFHVKNLCIKLKRNRNLQSLVSGAARPKITARSCTIGRRKSTRHNKNTFRGH